MVRAKRAKYLNHYHLGKDQSRSVFCILYEKRCLTLNRNESTPNTNHDCLINHYSGTKYEISALFFTNFLLFQYAHVKIKSFLKSKCLVVQKFHPCLQQVNELIQTCWYFLQFYGYSWLSVITPLKTLRETLHQLHLVTLFQVLRRI